MDDEEKKNKLDKLQDVLYSRNSEGIFSRRRHTLSPERNAPEVKTEWNIHDEPPKHTMNIPYTKILLGAFIFFILAFGFSLYKFFTGSNTISGNNIDIAITGPASIAGGSVLPLDIVLTNNNSTDLNLVDLYITFPDGTKDPTDLSTDMPRYSDVIGNMAPGQSQQSLVKAALFGEQNEQEVIQVTVQYRIPGSDSIFTKEKDYDVLISSSPVSITVTGPTQVDPNQPTNFSIEVDSNSLSTINDVALRVDYPFGFNFTSATPTPASNDDTGALFMLGDLAPGEKQTINLSGSIVGQDGEQRVFKFTVGSPDSSDSSAIGTPFAYADDSVSLNQPPVALNILLNQQADDQIAANAGDTINGDVAWQNNMSSQIYNMSIQVKLSGQTLDQTSVNADNGSYSSASNVITFDQSNTPDFADVNPSDQGDVTFSFASLLSSLNPNVLFGNQAITVEVDVYGSTNGNGSPQLLSSDTKVVDISSDLELLAQAFRTVGPFQNSGPFPPQVNSTSTYTITWTATDSYNEVDNVQVSGILPPNVAWEGLTSPSTESIVYDSNTGQVTWDVGDLESGVGDTNPDRSVSFQVGILPSLTDVGNTITLMGTSTISGTDAFSSASIGEGAPAVTTDITSDPAYTPNSGQVVN